MTTWLAPSQLLADKVVLNATEVAYVLELTFTRGAHAGEPNPALVADLVARGDLVPVDPKQPAHRRRFSVVAVQRYLDKCERQARVVTPISGVA